MSDLFFFGLVLLALGAALFCAGVWLIIRLIIFKAGATEVRATVISVETYASHEPDGAAGTTFRPTVRVRAPDGSVHEKPTEMRSADYDFAVGDEIAVLFNPNADAVRVPGVQNQFGLQIVLAVTGALFAVAGIGIALVF